MSTWHVILNDTSEVERHFSATFNLLLSVIFEQRWASCMHLECIFVWMKENNMHFLGKSLLLPLIKATHRWFSRFAFMFQNHTILQYVYAATLAIITKQWDVGITIFYRNRHYFYIARFHAQNMCNAVKFSFGIASHKENLKFSHRDAKYDSSSNYQSHWINEIEEIDGKRTLYACFLREFPCWNALGAFRTLEIHLFS